MGYLKFYIQSMRNSLQLMECDLITSCFDKPTMEDILKALEEDGSEWALQQIEVNDGLFLFFPDC